MLQAKLSFYHSDFRTKLIDIVAFQIIDSNLPCFNLENFTHHPTAIAHYHAALYETWQIEDKMKKILNAKFFVSIHKT